MGGLAVPLPAGAAPSPRDLCRLPPSHLSPSEVCRREETVAGVVGDPGGPWGPSRRGSPGQAGPASLPSPAINDSTRVAGTLHGSRVCINPANRDPSRRPLVCTGPRQAGEGPECEHLLPSRG